MYSLHTHSIHICRDGGCFGRSSMSHMDTNSPNSTYPSCNFEAHTGALDLGGNCTLESKGAYIQMLNMFHLALTHWQPLISSQQSDFLSADSKQFSLLILKCSGIFF